MIKVLLGYFRVWILRYEYSCPDKSGANIRARILRYEYSGRVWRSGYLGTDISGPNIRAGYVSTDIRVQIFTYEYSDPVWSPVIWVWIYPGRIFGPGMDV